MVGVNVTLIEHVPLAASVEPHLLLAVKSDAFAPVIETELMVSVVVSEFESVAIWDGLVEFTLTLPKLIVLGESVTVPDGAVPDPESAEVWGLLESLSETLRVADSLEVVEGVNTIVIAQVPLAARVAFTAGQVLV